MEALSGTRAGQYRIRVNDQYRICFRWEAGNAYDVELVDSHETGETRSHPMTATKKQKLAPVHPGEMLREEFLLPMELSINALSRALHVPPNHVSGIVNEKRGISATMALRLACYFGTSAELWLGLQQDYELDLARDENAARIEREVLPRAS